MFLTFHYFQTLLSKTRNRNRKQFLQACFLSQCCSFKPGFEKRFLFKIVFPSKPTLHIFIFKDFKSFKMESMYIFKTILINCIFTLPVHVRTEYFAHIKLMDSCIHSNFITVSVDKTIEFLYYYSNIVRVRIGDVTDRITFATVDGATGFVAMAVYSSEVIQLPG